MKSLMLFLREVLNELGTWCHASTALDYKTIERRVEHEGFSFLTITLPAFGADFERSLSEGWIADNAFPGFSRTHGIPKFLGGFLSLVFDGNAGTLLDNPSVDAIRAIRQLTLMFGKVGLPCSNERVDRAISKYIECESEVIAHDEVFLNELQEEFSSIGRLLFADMFAKVDQMVYYNEVIPKHGPGSTADRLIGNNKYELTEWTQRLEEIFPFREYLFVSHSQVLELEDQITIREPGAERPVRVITVPKTLKTPRIIAIEPTCMQFMQQAILEPLVETIEKDHILSAFLGFTSQIENQVLAKRSSKDGTLATLDLSEASDRVSNLHVRELLLNHPWLARAVSATRSSKADVPGYGVIPLAKFASMGSALCFPFEAMVFLTVIFVGIARELNVPLTRELVKSFIGRVRVYGDDIIVPVEYAFSVNRCLEAFGFKVNRRKSFWTGKFRESCGKEYYDGWDVSLTRVRSVFPTDRKHTSEIISTVSLRNQLYKAGYRQAVSYLDNLIEQFIPFPVVGEDSPVLGRHDVEGISPSRHCRNLQRPLVKGAVVVTRLPKCELNGYGALTKWYLKRGMEPFQDVNHLIRAGRPDSVDIKIRWASAL